MPLILAVDDEHSGLYFRQLILEHAGYTVLSATGIDEALRLFRSNPVDLVVTDHLLGRRVGTEMVREMKRSKPSVPVIVLSGTSSIPQPLADVNAFLSKSEGPEQLLELVKQLLGERSESANPAERMYGYRADEVIGKSVSMLLPPHRTSEVEQILTRLRQGGRIEHFETTRRTKEGRMLNVSLTISPVRDAQGNIIAASTIARNITQAKLAQEAIRNSERLAVAGRMAATIAHEINNPLEIVTSILYLLAKDQSLGETARKYVLTAEEELRRVGQITRSTLGLYRERDTAIVPVNIAELINSILLLYGRRLQSLDVHVEKRFDAPGNVMGVAGELRQVFSNLIANAIDALTVTGTKLVVHVRDSRDWSDLRRRGVRVTIADDGSGMSAETRASLFQPFFTTKGERGTGVGLWVSRGFVAKHGASIRLWSNTGARHGICFSVFLPNHPEFVPASTI
ncbi:MAG: PAS domain-containing sensor histidine kinase [Acidobacteria bacterium]|nr:MAG: PAS domain-containing sensor histidine kinase [Acidobacteriota bacterium]